jgi:hypothetical protein
MGGFPGEADGQGLFGPDAEGGQGQNGGGLVGSEAPRQEGQSEGEHDKEGQSQGRDRWESLGEGEGPEATPGGGDVHCQDAGLEQDKAWCKAGPAQDCGLIVDVIEALDPGMPSRMA